MNSRSTGSEKRFPAGRAWALCAGLLLLAAPAWALDLAVPCVHADSLWASGYSGAGVEVGVIDLFLADGTHPAISAGYRGAENFAGSASFVSQHATQVAGVVASRDATYTGAAPEAGFWTGQTTNRGTITKLRNQTVAIETFGQGLAGLNGNPVEVITLSISTGGVTDALDQWSLAIDHVVHTNGPTVTVAAGNYGPGAGTLGGPPSAAYNAIVVGATGDTAGSPSEDYSRLAGYSSRGPTADGRCKPDIVAPGSAVHMPGLSGTWTDASGTSFATPLVAGGAALLIDMGRSLGHSTDPKVIKSVLLNSADKLAGWSNTPTRPLDHAQGAGQMNLRTAHRQYLPDEADPGDVAGIGWDRQDLASGAENLRQMDVDLPAGAVVAATLTWDRIVTTDSEDIEDVVYSFVHLDNLELYLYRSDDLTTPVAASVSNVDNVEHIYHSIAEPGRYVIGVELPGTGAETYALSWRVGPGPGMDLPGDLTLDGTVNYLDLGILTTNYGRTDATWFAGDFTGEGLVNYLDLGILATNYGAGGVASEVPEPAGMALLLAAAAGLTARRGRGRRVV